MGATALLRIWRRVVMSISPKDCIPDFQAPAEVSRGGPRRGWQTASKPAEINPLHSMKSAKAVASGTQRKRKSADLAAGNKSVLREHRKRGGVKHVIEPRGCLYRPR